MKQTFLACMFCFPISDHVMIPQRTVPFKCCPIHLHPHVISMHKLFMKRQKPNSLENITWSELGKQNIQAKKFE